MNSNVHIDSLTHAFGSTQVLKGINLAIGNGVFGLLGPNGAGKTTLLRCLATAMDADGGRLRLLGYDPSVYAERRAFRRRLGYLPQQFGYYPNFTVWEFVEYFALLKEIPASETPQKVAQAIRRVGLADRARKQLRTLSGGMLRRAGIAQAIVNEPSLLLLDEPTAGLDPEQRVDFRRLLREAGEHGTVIVSTHLVEDVGAACSEVAVMAQGQIVFRGTPAALTDLGDPNGPGDSPLERGYIAALRSVQVEVLA